MSKQKSKYTKQNYKSSGQLVYECNFGLDYPYKINLMELTNGACTNCVIMSRLKQFPYYVVYMDPYRYDNMETSHCHDCVDISSDLLNKVKTKLKLIHKMRYNL